MGKGKDEKDSGFRPLESGLMPILDNGLTPPGKRSGEGLASILPYLVKALRAKPREAGPSVPEGGKQPPSTRA
jgi:hypothetical protein